MVRTQIDSRGQTFIGKGLVALTVSYRDRRDAALSGMSRFGCRKNRPDGRRPPGDRHTGSGQVRSTFVDIAKPA